MNVWRHIKSWPGRAVILMVRGYQLGIRPWIGANCRFIPGCSQYMIEAVEKYGVVQGVWKGLRRISRCHPLNPGGWDPP